MTPELNNNDADGRIADPDANCDKTHFHGTLFGDPDPANNACGQGRVAPPTTLSDVATDIVTAVNDELTAFDVVDRDDGDPVKPDYKRAKADCKLSKTHLTQAESDAETQFKNKKIDLETLKSINDKLEGAMREDKKCEDAARDKESKKVLKHIEAGVRFKREALQIVFKAGISTI